MSDRKRVYRESGDLGDSRVFELIRKVCLDSTENGIDRRAGSGPRYSAVSCKQQLVEVSDLLIGWKRNHRFAR